MSLSLWLAIAASLLIGSGEALASRFVHEHRSETITTSFFISGIAVTGLMIFMIPGTWNTRDIVLGLTSGVFNGFALLALYEGYRHVPVGVAAPIVGVQAAVIPVLYSVSIDGETLTGLAGAGIGLGVLALILVSVDPSPVQSLRRGLALAIIAGALYGIMLTLLTKTSEASGLWPLLPQRVVAFGVAAAVAVKVGAPILSAPGSRLRVMMVGAFGSLGAVAYVLAAQRGSISQVAIAGAQYPAATVLFAFLLFGARIRWWQTLGLALSGVAVSFIALG